MLDRDLAELYEVEIRVINQAVKRNKTRFPEDFYFQLTAEDLETSGSQIVILKPSSSKNYTQPTVFTEQGAYALSFVLRSPKAVEMGLFIARAFTYLRRFILKNENLMMELKNNDHLSKTFSNFRNELNKILLFYIKILLNLKKGLNHLKKKLNR